MKAQGKYICCFSSLVFLPWFDGSGQPALQWWVAAMGNWTAGQVHTKNHRIQWTLCRSHSEQIFFSTLSTKSVRSLHTIESHNRESAIECNGLRRCRNRQKMKGKNLRIEAKREIRNIKCHPVPSINNLSFSIWTCAFRYSRHNSRTRFNAK